MRWLFDVLVKGLSQSVVKTCISHCHVTEQTGSRDQFTSSENDTLRLDGERQKNNYKLMRVTPFKWNNWKSQSLYFVLEILPLFCDNSAIVCFLLLLQFYSLIKYILFFFYFWNILLSWKRPQPGSCCCRLLHVYASYCEGKNKKIKNPSLTHKRSSPKSFCVSKFLVVC